MSVKTEAMRYAYIDLIRVFSICAVIILHCICDFYADHTNAGTWAWTVCGFVNEICRTGVPLFFMISGFLLLREKIESIRVFYRRRFLKVLVPFLFYDVFYYVVLGIMHGKELSFHHFIGELFVNGSAYHLWFIYSILMLYLILPFVQRIVFSGSTKQNLLLFSLVIFQTTIKPLCNTLLDGRLYIFFSEDLMFGYLGYMLLGYLLGSIRLSGKTERLIYALGIASFLLVPVFSMMHAKSSGEFLFHGGYAWNHYMEAAAVFVFCKSKIKRSRPWICDLSKVTMDAYFIHVFLLELLKMVLRHREQVLCLPIYIVVSVPLSFLWGWMHMHMGNACKTIILPIRRQIK